MGTFLLVVLIIILMLLAAFVGAVLGMCLLVLLISNATADSIADTKPLDSLKELSKTFSRLTVQALEKRHGISVEGLSFDINVHTGEDGEV